MDVLGDARPGMHKRSAARHVAREDGLADAGALARGRIVLTARGRLLADAVTQKLTEP